jgi:hypothetical protein
MSKTYLCVICEKTFTDSDRVTLVQCDRHADTEDYICDEHDLKENEVKCGECLKEEKEKLTKCEVCEKPASEVGELTPQQCSVFAHAQCFHHVCSGCRGEEPKEPKGSHCETCLEEEEEKLVERDCECGETHTQCRSCADQKTCPQDEEGQEPSLKRQRRKELFGPATVNVQINEDSKQKLYKVPEEHFVEYLLATLSSEDELLLGTKGLKSWTDKCRLESELATVAKHEKAVKDRVREYLAHSATEVETVIGPTYVFYL